MKRIRSLFGKGSPRNTVVFLLSLSAVSIAALVWTGARYVRQDRLLEMRQLIERQEASAERLVAALEQVLLTDERRLSGVLGAETLPPEEDVAWLTAGPADLQAWPEKTLPFFPVAPVGREAPAYFYAQAEEWEFLRRDYDRAAAVLLPLTRSSDPAVRAGARLRLARVFRKAGRVGRALDIYGEMASTGGEDIRISGVPADLVARGARLTLLEELSRTEDAKREAQILLDDLQGRRWTLDRATYLYYREQAALRLGSETEPDSGPQALSEAVNWIWQNRRMIGSVEGGTSGRKSLNLSGRSVIILWRATRDGFSAIVAGPRYQRNHWFEPVLKGADFGGIRVGITNGDNTLVYGNQPPPGDPAATRSASVTGLPWDISVTYADLDAQKIPFVQRRRLMLIVIGMLAVCVLAASYFIGRAVSRELAAARLQSDFVSAVSHEFRTPLTSMRQFTEMLVEDEKLPAETRRAYYGAQERATRRLSRLVESFLDFGRMEAGARPYRLERLDAGRLVAATVEEFKQEIGAADPDVEANVPDRGPFVLADREALSQALWNLLDNAVKYSGNNPVVQVDVVEGNPVAIRVRDRGIGIPRAEHKRILRKFVRGSEAAAGGVKGTGIGLAMVKHIVEAHRGKIFIESEPGRGSTFTITLPGEGETCRGS